MHTIISYLRHGWRLVAYRLPLKRHQYANLKPYDAVACLMNSDSLTKIKSNFKKALASLSIEMKTKKAVME